MFGSHCFSRGNLIRILDGLFSELFAVVAGCFIALSGCGYVVNGSTNGQFHLSPDAIIFGSVPVGKVVTSKVLLVNESSASIDISQLNIAGQNFFANSQSSLPVTVSAGSTYGFVIGFKPDKESSYSGQFTIMSAAGKPIAQGSVSGSGISGSDSSSSPGLTVSASSLSFGDVTVNTTSIEPVTLSSTGTAPVTINSATLRGTGFTMSAATFPVTLNPSLAITLDVQFDPAVSGAITGQLAIQSNSSSNSAAVISLSGTGIPAKVDLSWEAPGNSLDSVVGYNIYRSVGSSSTFQLLNSSLDPQTTYVDSTVESGLAYDYFVKSVDSSGVESIPSNVFTATIP